MHFSKPNRSTAGLQVHPEPVATFEKGDEVQHLRQHVGNDGKVCQQPGSIGG